MGTGLLQNYSRRVQALESLRWPGLQAVVQLELILHYHMDKNKRD